MLPGMLLPAAVLAFGLPCGVQAFPAPLDWVTAYPPAAPMGDGTVIFMVPRKLDATTEQALEAVQAQITELPASVMVLSMGRARSLTDKTAKASELAAQNSAAGVFWLEMSDDELLLHLVDPEGERILVRRVSRASGDTAAIDSVAVIARGLTRALLEGRQIGLEPLPGVPVPPPEDTTPDDPPDEPAQPVDPKKDRGVFRVMTMYHGNSYAPQQSWQSGVSIAAAWQFKIGVYAGAGYTVSPQKFATRLSSQTADTALVINIARNPIDVFAGYQWRKGAFALDAQLGLVLDINTVRAITLDPTQNTPDEDRLDYIDSRPVLFGIAPRVAAHWRPLEVFSLFFGVGADFQVVNRQYFVEFFDPDTNSFLDKVTYLEPRVVRPHIVAGVSFYL